MNPVGIKLKKGGIMYSFTKVLFLLFLLSAVTLCCSLHAGAVLSVGKPNQIPADPTVQRVTDEFEVRYKELAKGRRKKEMLNLKDFFSRLHNLLLMGKEPVVSIDGRGSGIAAALPDVIRACDSFVYYWTVRNGNKTVRDATASLIRETIPDAIIMEPQNVKDLAGEQSPGTIPLVRIPIGDWRPCFPPGQKSFIPFWGDYSMSWMSYWINTPQMTAKAVRNFPDNLCTPLAGGAQGIIVRDCVGSGSLFDLVSGKPRLPLLVPETVRRLF